MSAKPAGKVGSQPSKSAASGRKSANMTNGDGSSSTVVNGTLHPPPRASTSASASRDTAVRMTALEVTVHNAILACPKKTIVSSKLRELDGLSGNDKTLIDTINALLKKHLCKTGTNAQGESVFVAVTKAEARELGLMDPDEKMVLDQITQSTNYGIWTRTLKSRTGLHQAVVNRVIKTLEQRKLIKNVKSVKHPTRKIYMLEHIVPSIDVTGGPWYAGNELDTAFIDQISDIAKKFIRSKSFPNGDPSMIWPMAHLPYLPTANDLLEFMQSNRILQVDLNVEHITAILDSLVYDGEIERIWMRRYREDGVAARTLEMDGTSQAHTPSSANPALPNGDGAQQREQELAKPAARKRKVEAKKAGDERHRSKRRKRERSRDSADIDDDSDGARGRPYDVEAMSDASDTPNEMSADEDWLPPALSASISSHDEWSEAQRAHRRPGPAGNDWYWVYRTCLTALPIPNSHYDFDTGLLTEDRKPIIQRSQRYPEIYESGLLQTPCGVCPVSEFCNNRGSPRVLPLPNEKDLTDVDGSSAGGSSSAGTSGRPASGISGLGDWRKSAIVRDSVRKYGYDNKSRKPPEALMQRALLKMKVPAGSGEMENADGVWQGGGRVGGQVIAPVNPANCVYYSRWFGEEVEW